MNKHLIQVNGLSKSFGNTSVIHDLTFKVSSGEIVGLLGPNGSGKTTCIRLLNGVLQADRGTLSVAGYDPQRDGATVRQMCGVLTESADFYRHLSGLENLKFYARLYNVTDPHRPEEVLARFGLAEQQHRKVGTYSTGMRRRLGLARAVLHKPSILFLDEPTNGLDPEGTRMVLADIKALNQREGTTIILCSHLLQQLETVCHRYLFIDRGRFIEQGSLSQLREKYPLDLSLRVETDFKPDSEQYHGVPVEVMHDGTLSFRIPDRECVPELLRSLTRHARVYSARLEESDLESIYFRIRQEKGL